MQKKIDEGWSSFAGKASVGETAYVDVSPNFSQNARIQPAWLTRRRMLTVVWALSSDAFPEYVSGIYVFTRDAHGACFLSPHMFGLRAEADKFYVLRVSASLQPESNHTTRVGIHSKAFMVAGGFLFVYETFTNSAVGARYSKHKFASSSVRRWRELKIPCFACVLRGLYLRFPAHRGTDQCQVSNPSVEEDGGIIIVTSSLVVTRKRIWGNADMRFILGAFLVEQHFSGNPDRDSGENSAKESLNLFHNYLGHICGYQRQGEESRLAFVGLAGAIQRNHPSVTVVGSPNGAPGSFVIQIDGQDFFSRPPNGPYPDLQAVLNAINQAQMNRWRQEQEEAGCCPCCNIIGDLSSGPNPFKAAISSSQSAQGFCYFVGGNKQSKTASRRRLMVVRVTFKSERSYTVVRWIAEVAGFPFALCVHCSSTAFEAVKLFSSECHLFEVHPVFRILRSCSVAVEYLSSPGNIDPTLITIGGTCDENFFVAGASRNWVV
ncbi:unnamed protein product [Notodromas monacha]|uniref:Uncharacterized protein n=1 Tax=Notodromas monacha TaxID=399045 RepID=A0A7R9BG36_9CRUS|nr:unnamed protein product [Notodromas monacha]CAG0913469.1 unnamed protein product [Notodromas monacha]